jgi:iron-sulfur cluster assembly accessory protein
MAAHFALTPAAQKFIGRIVRFSGLPAGAGLSLKVSPGGCSGYSAEFAAAAAPKDGEQAFEVCGLKIFLAAQSHLLLDGVTIDFKETATSSGLSFINPNQAACGCSSAEGAVPAAVAKIEIGAIGRAGRAATLPALG